MNPIVAVVFLCTVYFFLWPNCSLAQTTGAGQACVELHKAVELRVLAKPKYSSSKRACEKFDRKQLFEEGWRFVSIGQHRDLAPGYVVLLEIISQRKEILHILRRGHYFGEYIQQTYTDKGGHLKRESLRLAAHSFYDNEPPNASELQYYYMTEDFQWGDVRVETVSFKKRLVRLSDNSSMIPLSGWKKGIAYRRLIHLTIATKVASEGGDRFEVEIYYYDPISNTEQFFRRFEVKEAKQLTVFQFISAKPDRVSYAILKIVKDGKVLNRVRVTDPGVDNSEIMIAM